MGRKGADWWRVQGETAGTLKQRLRRALGLSEKEWTKFKVAHVMTSDKIEYFTDGASHKHTQSVAWALASVRLTRCVHPDAAIVLGPDWKDGDMLGLDHVDRSARTGRAGHFERAIVIKN
jgi:hypothetical protein